MDLGLFGQIHCCSYPFQNEGGKKKKKKKLAIFICDSFISSSSHTENSQNEALALVKWMGNAQNFSRARVLLKEDRELQLLSEVTSRTTGTKARLATFALPLPSYMLMKS